MSKKLFYLLSICYLTLSCAQATDDDPLKNNIHYKEAQSFIQNHWKESSSAIATIQQVTNKLQTIKDPQEALMWSYALRRMIGNGEGVGGISNRQATPAEQEIMLKAIRIGEMTQGMVNGWYNFHLCQRTHLNNYRTPEILPGAYSKFSSGYLDKYMLESKNFNTHLTQVYAYARSVQLQLTDNSVDISDKEKAEIPLLILLSAAAPQMPVQLGLNLRKTLNGEDTKTPVDFTQSLSLKLEDLIEEIKDLKVYKSMREGQDQDLKVRFKFNHKNNNTGQSEEKYLMWISPNGSCKFYTLMLLAGVYGYYETYDLYEHYYTSFFLFPWNKHTELFKTFYKIGGIDPYINIEKSDNEGNFEFSMSDSCQYVCLNADDILSKFHSLPMKKTIDSLVEDFYNKYDMHQAFNPYKIYNPDQNDKIKIIIDKYPPVGIFHELLSAVRAKITSPSSHQLFDPLPFFLFHGRDSWKHYFKTSFLSFYGENNHMDLSLSHKKSTDVKNQVFYLLNWVRAKTHEQEKNGSITTNYIDVWRPNLVNEHNAHLAKSKK